MYKRTTKSDVRYTIMHQLSTVYRPLREALQAGFDQADNGEEKFRLTKLLKQVKSYNNTHEVDATMSIMQGELSQSFVGKLDSDPDILNVQNGVLHLPTGRLDIHRPGYLCSKFADVAYLGINYPTPTVDSFLADIFNDDQALIGFMQHLWGYAINGRISEEIIAFLLGSGGNGKGVCKQMLEATLGVDAYHGVMSKDAVVKAPGQRPPTKGEATGYLAKLQAGCHRRRDQPRRARGSEPRAHDDRRRDGRIAPALPERRRLLVYTHSLIQTNYDPEIPPTLATQANMERRLIVVQFPNEYVSDDRFDESNPTHRHKDIGLKDRMEAPAVCEEFLTFLVRGSIAWYADPGVLHRHPPAVQAAKMAWLRRGDKLGTFLRSDHCEVDPEGPSEASELLAWEDNFHRKFQEFAGVNISKEELARQMGLKGYTRTKRGGRFDGEPAKRSLCYVGFKCECE